jgi:hypothetical protein
MAVSATFAADFTSFYAAIDKADVKLRGLDSSGRFVEKGLNRLVDNFSGRKLIQEATLMAESIEKIGGKSKLTESELISVGNKAAEAAEKMRKMGIDVPPKLDALAKSAQKPVGAFESMLSVVGKLAPALIGAFSLGSITSFAKGVSDFSGKMLDLEAQTRITTSRLQAFDFVGGDFDLTIEEITTSADQLAKRLGGDDKSVNEALEKLNVSGIELKKLDLDEVMFQIDEALVGVTNQMDRARILADLFGRSGAQLGRLMDGSLREIIKKTEETGPIIDKELLQKADRFGEMWEHGWKRFQAAAVTAIDLVVSAMARLQPPKWLTGGELGENLDKLKPGDLPPGLAAALRRNTPQGFIGPRMNPVKAAVDQSIVIGGGIDAVIKESGLDKGLRDWGEATNKAADETQAWVRDMHNKRGELLMNQDAAFLNSPTSEATKKLRDLMLRSGTPGILPNMNAGLTAGLMFGPGAVSQSGGGGGLGAGSLARLTSFGGSLSNFTGALPDVILGALQGGGNITKSIGSLLGGSLLGSGTGLNKALTGGLSNVFGKTIGGFAGSLLPGIGSLLGPAISGLTKLFGGLFGGEGKKTNRARDSAIDEFTGISGDKGASQAKFRELATAAGVANTELDKLFSTKRTKEFESAMDSISKRINTFSSEQEADSARLAAAIEKYGIAFEEAGAAFQKQKLDEQAKELVEDWRVLVGSGIDLGVVNDKMSDAINEYLQTAIRVGQEVPSAMRPILQKMLEQGTLTDEAGVAITDMEAAGIHFSETMTEGFDKVVKKLDELIQKLGLAAEGLGGLALPSGIADTSGLLQSDLVPIPMASGGRGRVTSRTLFVAGEKGPEDFAFSGANRSFTGMSQAEVVSAIQVLDSRLAAFMRVMPIALRDAVMLAR